MEVNWVIGQECDICMYTQSYYSPKLTKLGFTDSKYYRKVKYIKTFEILRSLRKGVNIGKISRFNSNFQIRCAVSREEDGTVKLPRAIEIISRLEA